MYILRFFFGLACARQMYMSVIFGSISVWCLLLVINCAWLSMLVGTVDDRLVFLFLFFLDWQMSFDALIGGRFSSS